MSANALALLIQADDGLSLSEILEGVPHDAASIFVYVLLGVALYFIWKGTRPTKARPGPQ